jgi:DNA-binding SARP family transcriptional activator
MTATLPVRDRHAHRALPPPAPDRVRAAAAALTLVVLLVGAPVLLAVWVGNPLPDHLPTGAQLRHALTSPLADRTVVNILAAVAWLAWLHLLASVVIELFVQLRGLPRPRQLPVLGVNQQLAQRLVAAALVLLPSAPTFAHATTLAGLTRAPAAVQPTDHVTVVRMSPASLSAGAQPRANATTAIHSPGNLSPTRDPSKPGTKPHKVYVVQPPHGRHYDSLWDIAARHLGDGRRYREIYELNKGRPQPDGGELTRASLIQPGWVLLLPADATGPGVRDATALSGPHDGTHQKTLRPGTGHPASPPIAHVVPAPGPREPDAPRSSLTRDPGPSTSANDHGSSAVPFAAGMGLGLGLGSLGALAALQRARRIASRRRRLGTRPAPTPPELLDIEPALHHEARRADSTAGAVRLACALSSAGDAPPLVRAVFRRADGSVDLSLESPMPAPAPFVTTATGWQLPADQAGFTFAVDDAVDPLPSLLPIGEADAADVFVDLEHDGLVTISGENDAVAHFLVTAAAALTSAPWAGLTHVLVPTRLADRIGSLEHVEAVTDLSGRSTQLLSYADRITSDITSAGHDDLPAARQAGAADTIAVMVLLGWTATELPDAIADAGLDPRAPLIAMVSGEHPQARGRWQLCDGRLSGTPAGVPVLVPDRAPQADQVAALIEHTRTAPPVPVDHPAYAESRADAPPQTEPGAIEIGVLGPVELRGVDTPRRQTTVQVLVYLALHRTGVTAEQLSTALWPEEIVPSGTLRNRVAEARAVVGGAITDGPGWRLAEHITTDWQRFQQLVVGSSDEQRAAVDMIRGRPLEGFGADEWLATDLIRADMEAAIVDVTAEVAERALSDGDASLAFRTARVGLKANPYEERLFRLAMRAADAEGSIGKVRSLMRELRAVLGVDVEPDDQMEQETVELYEQLVEASRRQDAT